jgi:hypothetical protein
MERVQADGAVRKDDFRPSGETAIDPGVAGQRFDASSRFAAVAVGSGDISNTRYSHIAVIQAFTTA